MAAPKVYKSTDANAPVLNGTTGSAINFIRAICVTGYGNKAPLGWQEIFSKTGVIVIRPPESVPGNRLFYRIDDTVSGSYQGTNKFKIETYESMSDIDTGAGYMGPEWIYKSTTADNVARNWTVVGDAAGFHTAIVANGSHAELNYQGHGIPFFSSDAWFSIISGRGSQHTYYAELPEIQPITVAANGDNCVRVARKLSGEAGSIGTPIALYPGGGFSIDIIMGSVSLPAALTYPVMGKLIYSRPFLNDGAEKTMRGYLPGLYCPEHGAGLTHGQVYPDNGLELMALKISYYNTDTPYGGWALIDIGEGFRP